MSFIRNVLRRNRFRIPAMLAVCLSEMLAAADCGAKQLAWDPSEAGEAAGYIVYRGDPVDNVAQVLAEVSGNILSLELTAELGLEPGVLYCFSVSAYDLAGNKGSPSNVVCDIAIEADSRGGR